jgi:hypothetical protein
MRTRVGTTRSIVMHANPPDPGTHPVAPRRRRRLRRTLCAVLAVPLLVPPLGLAALAAWLHGDPTDRMLARVGELVAAEPSAPRDEGAYRVVDEELVSSSGLRVRIRTKRPSAEGPPRRALLILGGVERGRGAVDLIDDTRGCVVSAIDYPYDGEKRKLSPAEIVQSFGALREGILDTPSALLLARQHLARQPDVDPERIELVGASLGGIFVVYAGALDDGFDRVFTLHSGGDIDRLISVGLQRHIGLAPLRASVAWLPRYMLGGYGPEHFAPRIAPRPYVMITAADDERIPRESVLSLFEAACEPKQLVWVEGWHVDGDRRETLAPLLAAMFLELDD